MNKAFKLSMGGVMISLLVACGSDEQKTQPVEDKTTSVVKEESQIPQNKKHVSQVKKKKTALINGTKFTYDAPIIKPGVTLFDVQMQSNVKVTQKVAVVLSRTKQVALKAAQYQLAEIGTVKMLADGVFEVSFDTDTDMLEKYNTLKALPFIETTELQLRSNPKSGAAEL